MNVLINKFSIFLALFFTFLFISSKPLANDLKSSVQKKAFQRSQKQPSIKSDQTNILIEKAQNLSLQKQRFQALELLKGIELTDPKVKIEIKNLIENIATVFFSESTQQAYELSRGLWKTDSGRATAKMEEASRAEPDNLLILVNQAVWSLSKGDCLKAKTYLEKYEIFMDSIDLLILVRYQLRICQKESIADLTLESLEKVDPKLHIFFLDLILSRMSADLANKSEAKSTFIDILKNIEKRWPGYLDTIFWESKIADSQKRASLIDKYTQACRNLSASAQLQFFYNPWFCQRLTESVK